MILRFIGDCSQEERDRALDLLCAISEKDRRDISEEVLTDNLMNTPVMNHPLYVDYVLNPRVENEGLVPYKAFFTVGVRSAFLSSPAVSNLASIHSPDSPAYWVLDVTGSIREGMPMLLATDTKNMLRDKGSA